MRVKIRTFILIISIIIAVIAISNNISKFTTNASMESLIKAPVSQKTESYKLTNDNTEVSESSNESNKSTSSNLLEQAYYDYEGTIDKQINIHMSIYAKDGKVTGTYFYDRYGEEISVTGKIDWRAITLTEYDKSGRKTGTFEGILDNNDKIQGNWKDSSGKNTYPFYLELKDIVYGNEQSRYSVATKNKSASEVESFVSNIKAYINSSDANHLADNICYPIVIYNHQERITINNKTEFMRRYNDIFSNEYKDAINKTFAKFMFANSKGIMFGSSYYNMWINDIKNPDGSYQLKITTIND